MASVLQQLEGNDALLLMYLADELPGADRAEVDRMLAVDAGLREQLERLRDAYGWFSDEMTRDDRSVPLAVSQGAAVRRVGRAMRQWHLRRLAAAPATPAAPSALRYPWWAYPLAAAASVVIAFLVWWGNTDRPVLSERNNFAIVTPPPGDPLAGADPATVDEYEGEMIAQSLGFGEYRPEQFNGPGGDWEDSRSLYAAVAPTDSNVLMLLNNSPADETDGAGPDDEPI